MSEVDETTPEKCDLLIRNAYVITMDADNSKHPNAAQLPSGAGTSSP